MHFITFEIIWVNIAQQLPKHTRMPPHLSLLSPGDRSPQQTKTAAIALTAFDPYDDLI